MLKPSRAVPGWSSEGTVGGVVLLLLADVFGGPVVNAPQDLARESRLEQSLPPDAWLLNTAEEQRRGREQNALTWLLFAM